MIELGKIEECSDISFSCATDTQTTSSERLAGIDALAALNDSRLAELVDQIASNSINWSERITRLAVIKLFPKHLSIAHLFEILPRLKWGENMIGELSWHLPQVISDFVWRAEELNTIRNGLTVLISEDLKREESWPHFVSKNSHLSELLAVTCIKGLQGGVTTAWLHSSVIALLFINYNEVDKDNCSQLTLMLNELPAVERRELFWETDTLIQSLHPNCDPWKRFVETTISWKIHFKAERDIDWIREDLADAKRPEEERAMILEGAARLYRQSECWLDNMNELKSIVADVPALRLRIDAWIEQAMQKSEPDEWEIKSAERKRVAARKNVEDLLSWKRFWKNVSENPEEAFTGNTEESTVWNLWRAMSKAGSWGRESGWNRQFIEDYLSKEIADRLRLSLMQLWRDDCPTLTSERPDDAKGTYLVKWQLGLAGVYAESENPLWATRLSCDEARLATRYATIELNSLPAWMEALVNAHPAEVEETLGNELLTELDCKSEKPFYSMLLQHIGHASIPVIQIFLPRIRGWLDTWLTKLAENCDESGEMERLRQVTGFLAEHGDEDIQAYLCHIARKYLAAETANLSTQVWLHLLLRFSPKKGVDALENRLDSISPSQRSEAVILIGNLFDDRHGSVNFSGPQFTPPILLRLMRLIYRHVRPEDDVRHKGAYSPDERDDAERARNSIVNLILASKGEEGWSVKLEMSADPLCAHFKDRILAIADESWAEEVDADAFSDGQAIALDRSGEAPPTTNETMFSLMVDRLEDIDDLLLRDVSPRESWAKITEERVMRREISRELSHLANGAYTIDQEAVTADEKETDIRMRSTASLHEAIIELKLADDRTAQDLLDTLETQLVTKYMASETSRSGCLLITLAKERKWDNPSGGPRLNFLKLVELLRNEALRVVAKHGYSRFRLHVHALDLNRRLPTEAKTKV
jgi:hypothetical protein